MSIVIYTMTKSRYCISYEELKKIVSDGLDCINKSMSDDADVCNYINTLLKYFDRITFTDLYLKKVVILKTQYIVECIVNEE